MFSTCPALVEAARSRPSLPTYCSTILFQLHNHGYKFHYANVLMAMPIVTTLELSTSGGFYSRCKKLMLLFLNVDPVPVMTYLSVFMDTCLPSVNHMKSIAHRVSTCLSSSEIHLHTHVNELLSKGVS